MGISLGKMSLTFVSRLSNGRPKVCKAKALKAREMEGDGWLTVRERQTARMPNDYKLPVAILITATTAKQ